MTAKWALFVAVLALAWVADNVSARATSDDSYEIDIEDKYIVVLKGEGADRVRVEPGQLGLQRQVPSQPDVMYPRAFVEKVIREHGEIAGSLTLRHVYSSIFNGFAATITDDSALETIRSYQEVKSVEPESVFSVDCLSGQLGPAPPPPPPVPSWGLDRIDQRILPLDNSNPPTYKGDGAGVHIYVIDSGTLKTHTEFAGRFSPQGYDEFGDPVGTDCRGHGTNVAGIAAGATYGVAKKAIVHSVRVLNCAGRGPTSGILNGMEWVTKNAIQPAVVTMSLKTSSLSHQRIAVDTAVNTMTGDGIVVVVSAGNDGIDACMQSPASAPSAITVGATDQSDNRATFTNGGASNWGTCLDIFAPGKRIKAAGKDSDTDTSIYSGTSQACPHVAGAVAILQGLQVHTPAQVEGQLRQLSTKDKVIDPGNGSVNRLLYIGTDTDHLMEVPDTHWPF